MRQHPLFYALAAIVLWASLATLGASVAALPPFFTVGVSLMVGSLCAIRHWRQWRLRPPQGRDRHRCSQGHPGRAHHTGS